MPEALPPPVAGLLYRSFPQPDGTFRLEFLSDGAEDVLEASAAELVGMLAARTVPLVGTDAAAFYALVDDAAHNFIPRNHEFGYRTPASGTERWFRAQDFPQVAADGTRYYAGVLIDVTALKAAEEQARGLYRELLSYIDNTPLAVIEWDAAYRVRRWTGQAEAVFGWTEAEVLGKRPDDWRFVHDDDAPGVERVMAELASTARPRNTFRNRNFTRAGEVRHCQWYNSVLASDGGRMKSCLSLVLDVTDTVRAEEELVLGERRLKTALACAEMLGWEADLQSNAVYLSSGFGEFFGVPAGPVDLFQGAVHPEDRAPVDAALRQCLAAAGPWKFEFRGAADDRQGRPRYFSSRGQTFRGADGTPDRFIGVTSDISRRRRRDAERTALDRAVQEAQRAESLGTLAGGVAHDFNNLLTVVLGNAALAHQFADDPEAVRGAACEIEAAARRAAELCQAMLAYAGRAPHAPQPVDLSALVFDAAGLLEPAVAKRVRVRCHSAGDLPPALADPIQVKQVLLNLVTNAAEALGDEGGDVAVETGETAVGPGAPPAGYHPAPKPGRYVKLVVRDAGCGMDAAVRGKIFDPFFSTKFPGRGLGMAAVLGIVRGHAGAIHVASAPHFGTTVTVLFPVSPPPPPG